MVTMMHTSMSRNMFIRVVIMGMVAVVIMYIIVIMVRVMYIVTSIMVIVMIRIW